MIEDKQFPLREMWLNSMASEMCGLIQARAMTPSKLPKGRKLFRLFFIFTWKTNGEGIITRPKSRSVFQGSMTRPGIDYDIDQVSSPVAHADTVRTVLANAVQLKRHLVHMDMKQAFLSSKVRDQDAPDGIFIQIPKMYRDKFLGEGCDASLRRHARGAA